MLYEVITEAALAVARGNARRLGLEVSWRLGAWFAAVRGERYDVIVSNPPYVAQGDPHLARGDLRFEPRAALDGGSDGLVAIRTIVAQAPAHLVPGGWLLLEHGFDQGPTVRGLLADAGLGRGATWRDLVITSYSIHYTKLYDWLLLEHGFDQGPTVLGLLADAGLGRGATWRDLTGHARVSAACRAAA